MLTVGVICGRKECFIKFLRANRQFNCIHLRIIHDLIGCSKIDFFVRLDEWQRVDPELLHQVEIQEKLRWGIDIHRPQAGIDYWGDPNPQHSNCRCEIDGRTGRSFYHSSSPNFDTERKDQVDAFSAALRIYEHKFLFRKKWANNITNIRLKKMVVMF